MLRIMGKSFPYPVCLSLEGKNCLILGFGKTGRRKLSGLLECGAASVLILDPFPREGLPSPDNGLLSARARIEARGWTPKDLEGVFLVFACSSDSAANKELSDFCARKNILCCNAESPSEGSFILPAKASAPPLAAAVSTDGASPLLAARMKKELEKWLAPKAGLARLMGLVREAALAQGFAQEKNRKIFITILDSQIPRLLEKGERAECLAALKSLCPFLSESDLDKIHAETAKCLPKAP